MNTPDTSTSITPAQLQQAAAELETLMDQGHTVLSIDLWVPEEDDYDPEEQMIEVSFELKGDGPGGLLGTTSPINKNGKY